MYQLVLGIGWDALKTRFQSYDQNPHIVDWKRIDQHKVLFNKVIVKYYIEQAKKEGINVDRVMQYINSISYSNAKIERAKVNGQTIKEVFGNFFRYKSDEEGAILYGSESERCSGKKCKYQFDVAKGVFEDKYNLLSLYSAENIITLFPEDNAQRYLEFIRHMLANEQMVSFIDPFIAENDQSRREFCDTYLPMVTEGAVVNLFLARNEGSQHYGELKQAAKRKNIKLDIYTCRKDTMHDRFITTSDAVLNIGAGILFYNRQEKIREVTSFGYQKKEKKTSDLEIENKLAGGNVEGPQ